jgi:hypothetical protein
VKIVVFGIAFVAFVQSAGGTLLNRAPEPVLMLVWGFALLAVASGARSLLVRGHIRRAPAEMSSAAQIPRSGFDRKMVVASRS